ncbi:hypothetical protein Plhal304r1_c063g0150291 [Plasmopara halstedii]
MIKQAHHTIRRRLVAYYSEARLPEVTRADALTHFAKIMKLKEPPAQVASCGRRIPDKHRLSQFGSEIQKSPFNHEPSISSDPEEVVELERSKTKLSIAIHIA